MHQPSLIKHLHGWAQCASKVVRASKAKGWYIRRHHAQPSCRHGCQAQCQTSEAVPKSCMSLRGAVPILAKLW